jgi:hypothetical protein
VPDPSVRDPSQRAFAVRIGIPLTVVHVRHAGRGTPVAGIMVRMPPDQPPVVAPPESVIEFGPSPDESGRPASRRRRSLADFGLGVARDRRVVPLAAVLGGVALFASLVSEWQVTTIDTVVFNSEDGRQPIPSDLFDLGGWSAGYVVGVFVLVTATVLVLFGPPAGRRYARLAGLSVGGVLLAVLAALGPTLNDVSRTLGYVIRYQVQRSQYEVTDGRGLWCAVVGVLAVMVALYLAGRHTAPVVVSATDVPAEPLDEASFWRRPHAATVDDEDRPPDAPFDLTVGPTTPFTSLNDDRDKPTGRDGISG